MMSEMGARIKASRKKLGYTQKKLAALLDVSQPTIADLEKHPKYPPKYLNLLANILKVDPMWLVFGVNQEKKTQYTCQTAPLISLATDLVEGGGVVEREEGYQQIPIYTPVSGPAFAFRLLDIRFDPNEPQFLKPQSIIVIETGVKIYESDFVLWESPQKKGVFSFAEFETKTIAGMTSPTLKFDGGSMIIDNDQVIGRCIQVITPMGHVH